jgi:two-component system cell cycle response regulator DivK
MSKYFKDQDFATVASGEEALELLKEAEFDAFLVDINLGRGHMDGVEFLTHLRAHDTQASKPAFAVTAYAMPTDKEKYLSLGFDAYFAKPVNLSELKSTLLNWPGQPVS